MFELSAVMTSLFLAGTGSSASADAYFNINALTAEAQATTSAARSLAPSVVASSTRSRVYFAPREDRSYRATSGNAQDRALAYVSHYATRLGIASAQQNGATIKATHRLASGGSLVQIEQRVKGIEVFGQQLNVIMNARGELIALAGELNSAAGKQTGREFQLSDQDAIARVLGNVVGSNYAGANNLAPVADPSPDFRGYKLLEQSDAVRVEGRVRVKSVYFPVGKKLVPAYFVEYLGRTVEDGENHAYQTIVSALDGQRLYRRSRTFQDKFKYKVWAEEEAPYQFLDGPEADFTPHPTGKNDGSKPSAKAPVMIEIEGLNHPAGQSDPDPWLESGASETKGNNVDAYSDRDQTADGANNGFTPGDLRAKTTSSNTFDRVYDHSKDPGASDDQIMAAVTQIFYANNWLHDYWYDRGFDEISAVGQEKNYGRGGAEGDPIQAQAQDSADAGTRNNANMSAMSDGTPPVMQMYLWDVNSGVTRDGTIDNQIVAHEWGHYWHHRLVNCGGTSCGSMSEGWGDYIALHHTVKEGDDADGVYAVAGYSTAIISGPDNYYFGIRRYPYSRDLKVSPLTFKHMKTGESLPSGIPMHAAGPDNAEVHNAGEIWAATLHEAHLNMLELSSYNGKAASWQELHDEFGNILVAGMKLTPPEPSFTEQRDAILAAAAASSDEAFEAVAKGFAKRGMGSCAVAPPPDSTTNAEIKEDFDLAGLLSVSGWAITDEGDSCDGDGKLDVGETGKVVVTIFNAGQAPLKATTATIESSSKSIKLEGSGEFDVPEIAPQKSYDLEVEATLVDSLTDVDFVPVSVTLKDSDACESELKLEFKALVNSDVEEGSSSDDFESPVSAWKVQQDVGGNTLLWSREMINENDESAHQWHGVDSAGGSDTSLLSPKIEVSGDKDFVLKMKHAFSFETGPADAMSTTDVYWDGAVLEVSTDDGKTWKDASDYGDPGYNGTIGVGQEAAGNPLYNREGFVGKSDGFPALKEATIDFGDKLAGKTVILRFRIGTDQASGDVGWLIDDVSVEGAEKDPFNKLKTDEDKACEDSTDTNDSSGSNTDSSTGSSDTGTGDSTGSNDASSSDGTGDGTGSEGTQDGSTTGGSSNASDDGSSGDPSGDGGDSGGCGCTSSGTQPWSLALLSLLGLPLMAGRRRRRS